jgi:hypothetical protein
MYLNKLACYENKEQIDIPIRDLGSFLGVVFWMNRSNFV